MGEGAIRGAVSDAGPLLHLGEIGRIELLNMFEPLHIPDAVWKETVQQGRVSNDQLRRLETVRRHTLPQRKVAQFARRNGL